MSTFIPVEQPRKKVSEDFIRSTYLQNGRYCPRKSEARRQAIKSKQNMRHFVAMLGESIFAHAYHTASFR